MLGTFRGEAVLTTSKEDETEIIVRVAVPGAKIPMYTSSGEPLVGDDGSPLVFTATETNLKKSVELFKSGKLNIDHDSEQLIGDLSRAFYDDGLCIVASTSHSVEDVLGWSIEGELKVEGNEIALQPVGLAMLITKSPACPLDQCMAIGASWDGDAATVRLMNWSKDSAGKVHPEKIDKYFLKPRTGDGSVKAHYHYPVGDVADGKADYSEAGLRAAYGAASGARGAEKDTALITKIKGIYKKKGWELPPGLQAKGQAAPVLDWNDFARVSVDDGGTDVLTSVSVSIPKTEISMGISSLTLSDAVASKQLAKQVADYIINLFKNKTGVGGFVVGSKEVEVKGEELDLSKFGISSLDEIPGLKKEADEWRSKFETQATQLSEVQAKLKAIELEKTKADLKQIFVPGFYEGEVEKEGKKVPKLDGFAEEYMANPAAFMAKNQGSLVTVAGSVHVQGSSESTLAKTIEEKKAKLKAAREGLRR